MANAETAKKLAFEYLHETYGVIPGLRRAIEGFVDDAVAFLKPSPVRRDETVAVSFDAPKTSALLYDRVWTPDAIGIPPSIIVISGSDEEIALRMVTLSGELLHRSLSLTDRSSAAAAAAAWETLGRVGYARRVALELANGGISAVPTYRSAAEWGDEYHAGTHDVVIGVLRDIAVPIESELSWEQILELRNDPASRRKLRRFKHWLDTDMVGRSPSFIRDEIAIRLDNYNGALRKHGVKAVLGTLATAMDAKVLIGGSAAVASLSYAADHVAAMLAGGAIVVGSAAVYLARTLLDAQDVRNTTNPEIAFVAEVGARVKPPNRLMKKPRFLMISAC